MPLRLTVVLPGLTFKYRLTMGSSVGGSLTELTVSKKGLLAVSKPSLTVRVMVLVPNWLAAGVIVTVRFAPYPSVRMLAAGARVGLEELAVTVKAEIGVSMSFTVNGTVMEESSFTV